MANSGPKRRRLVDTFQARDLHEKRKQTSVRSFIRHGLVAGCSLEEIERRKERVFVK